ncbi:uncharacterized protein HKW66_Vig0057300 [Vigna angularis]|uniref:FAM192A/Fyv6 N-terminal domain-containing protein n=1 Tax=Phaseolus angularis TaxID=3914 RepID=A0A8T0L3I6_PHAAN|nr:uncharacterized protein HKW66_Vig0057300 [Vigna angularis]
MKRKEQGVNELRTALPREIDLSTMFVFSFFVTQNLHCNSQEGIELGFSEKMRKIDWEGITHSRSFEVQILKENKDKKDAEFNERFKHRPPKALDEDETEFLDNYEAVSSGSLFAAFCFMNLSSHGSWKCKPYYFRYTRREYERQVADEEAQQIRSFQAAVAAQSNIVHEIKEKNPLPVVQEQKSAVKKNPASRPLGMIIKVKPQAKKARLDEENTEEISKAGNTPPNDKSKSLEPIQALNDEANKSREIALTGLVSYSDESDDDL